MKHELIKTDNYLLVVDDSPIQHGDYHIATRIVKTNGDKAIAFTDQEQLDAIAEIGGAKKIIAHLPLNNSPILEGVPLLPPLEQEDDVEKLAQSAFTHPDFGKYKVGSIAYYNGYKDGYNKAKENLHGILSDFYYYATYGEVCKHETINEFIQSLSQPMPVGFECEMGTLYFYKKKWVNILPKSQIDKLVKTKRIIKTTTNSQGQTVWVGKYIY